jgi:predicted metal-binding protein
MKSMPAYQVAPVFDPNVRKLCVQPYPLHPRGCPNFAKSPRCPPKVDLLDKVFDLRKPCWVIYNTFSLRAHVRKMQELHPKWSDRQLYCCLYWQGKARKKLKEEIEKFYQANDPLKQCLVTTCPEAMGLNVTETIRKIGILLEWPPIDKAVQVAFAGAPRMEKKS